MARTEPLQANVVGCHMRSARSPPVYERESSHLQTLKQRMRSVHCLTRKTGGRDNHQTRNEAVNNHLSRQPLVQRDHVPPIATRLPPRAPRRRKCQQYRPYTKISCKPSKKARIVHIDPPNVVDSFAQSDMNRSFRANKSHYRFCLLF